VFRASPAEWVSKHIIGTDCSSSACLAAQAAYRLSFVASIFFLIHWIVSTPRNLFLEAHQRVAFNNTGFFWKLVVVAGVAALTFIPGGNSFFATWAWIAMALSVLFLIAQLLVLLEFAYAWSEDWSAREDSKYQKALLACCVVMFLAVVAITGLAFHWFGAAGCSGNQTAIALVLVAGVASVVASIALPRGSIVPACVVALYCVWTVFTAFMGRTDVPGCNTLTSSSSDTLQIVISTVVTVGALLISTLSAATSRQAFAMSELEAVQDAAAAEAENLAHFHGMMFLAAAYISMLVTDWSVLGAAPNVATVSGGGKAAEGAKLGTVGVCFLFYGWSLVAPYVLSGREF